MSMQSYAKNIIRLFAIGKDVSIVKDYTMFLDRCLDWEIEFSSFLHDTPTLILHAIIIHLDNLYYVFHAWAKLLRKMEV